MAQPLKRHNIAFLKCACRRVKFTSVHGVKISEANQTWNRATKLMQECRHIPNWHHHIYIKVLNLMHCQTRTKWSTTCKKCGTWSNLEFNKPSSCSQHAQELNENVSASQSSTESPNPSELWPTSQVLPYIHINSRNAKLSSYGGMHLFLDLPNRMICSA